MLLDSGSEQLQRIRYIGEDSVFLVTSSSCRNLVQDTPTPRVKVPTLPSARVFSNLCSKETRLSVQLQPQQRTCINQIGYRKQLDTNNSSQCCRHRMQAGCRDVKELHLGIAPDASELFRGYHNCLLLRLEFIELHLSYST